MSMDAGTRRRLLLGFGAQWVSKLAYTGIQLAQVPLFLHFWSENVYGEWITLNALPSYLLFSNLGFSTVAGNEMSMLVARGERDAALRVFQSCWWLICITLTLTTLAVVIVLQFVSVSTIFNLHEITDRDAKLTVAYLGVTILLGQLEGMMQSAYRSVDRNPFGSFLRSMMTIAAFIGTMVPVVMGYGPRTAALAFAGVSVAGILVMGVMTQRAVPWISYGWSHASFSEIKRLFMPAMMFVVLPLGNALNLQGTVLVVSYTLGAEAVVIFTTARTVSRVALQMIQMITTTFEPEFSKAFALRNHPLVQTLHRRACQSSLVLSGAVVAMMIVGGPFLLSHWTHGKVPPSRPLLSLLLLVVVVYSLHSTSSTLLTATNQHKRLAVVYVGATGFTVALTWAMAKHFGHFGMTQGLYAASASLLVSEILMNLYVLPNTLRIAHDTFPAFVRSMFSVPPGLHPRALMRRLGRGRVPESAM